MNLRAELGLGVNSIEAIRSMVGVGRPASLRVILNRYREPIVFDEPLVTPDGVALGGHHTITLEHDGHFRHQGHMRATGFPSFTFGVRTVLSNDAGVPAVLAANGQVHGTNEPGDRESAWDQSGQNGLIALHWAQMKVARPQTAIDRDADFFGAVGDVLSFVGGLAAGGIVGGPGGRLHRTGYSRCRTHRNRSTSGNCGTRRRGRRRRSARCAPGAIVPAIAAGAVAGTAVELSIKHRPMTGSDSEQIGQRDPPERDFAARVFGPTLPIDLRAHSKGTGLIPILVALQ
jgi:hypothetical protein